MKRRLVAEAIGTAMLLLAIARSGIIAVFGGNAGLALLVRAIGSASFVAAIHADRPGSFPGRR